MPIVRVDNCGLGLNSDLTPEELGNGVWSLTENMRFNNGYAERFRGTSAVFTTPTVTPYFIQPYATTSARFWNYAGIAQVFVDDGTTQTNITRLTTTAIVSITRVGTTATLTSTAHGLSNGNTVTVYGATPSQYNGTFVIGGVAANTFTYTMTSDPGSSATSVGVLLKPGAAVNNFTGAIDNKWTGGVINGVMILNNGVDMPQYWGGDTSLKLRDIPGWSSAWTATAMRPFKNFVVALGITKSGTSYPHMVKWSTTLNPGAITAGGDWDETNPAIDAGEQDLAETSDLLVDCLPLGDVNIIYKERSMYAMTYVGAPYIFRFQRLPGESGMLARGCAVNTPLGHVVLTAGDVVVNNGSGVQSIANGAVRSYIFNNIDSTNYKRAFITANPQKNEVWICFPFGSSETCNKAMVWNWIDKTWGTRTLTNVTHGAFGQINIGTSLTTWAGDSDSWETDATSWNENEYSPAEARLLMCHSTPLISLTDTGTTDFSSLITSTLERTGMTMGDPYMVKTWSSIYPQIDGVSGATVNVQVGASMFPDGEVTWQTAQPFVIGTSLKIDSFASGRFLAVRFTNSDYGAWRMKSFGGDYVNSGRY